MQKKLRVKSFSNLFMVRLLRLISFPFILSVDEVVALDAFEAAFSLGFEDKNVLNFVLSYGMGSFLFSVV